MFGDATDGKVRALRVLSTNPCAGVRGSTRGASKSKQWLYPCEAARLLSCATIPVRWRVLYALACYLYLRPGELAALDWKRVYLAEGYVDIQVAMDLKNGVTKPCPKTKHRRKVPIHPSLRPLFDALAVETGGVGLVVQHDHENNAAEHGFPPLHGLAKTLRMHLKRAGVNRADLFEDSATVKQITFYDLRATGITWEALAGTEHTRIMQRAGHQRFETTLLYIREAETLGMNVGEPFPPLPKSLLETVGDQAASATAGRAQSSKAIVHTIAPRGRSRNSKRKVGVPKGIRNVTDRPRGRLGHVTPFADPPRGVTAPDWETGAPASRRHRDAAPRVRSAGECATGDAAGPIVRLDVH